MLFPKTIRYLISVWDFSSDTGALLFISFMFLNTFCFAQKDTIKYCNPKLEGMSRSKGFSITYERGLNTTIKSHARDTSLSNSSATIKRNNKFEILLHLPIWNKPRLKAVLGLRYFYEEFQFQTPQNLEYPLYRNLEKKNLKILGSNIMILRPLNETSYLLFRGSAELNGDYYADQFPKSSFLKYTIAAIYGRKTCPTKTTAIGLYFSNTFGVRSLFPVLLYNNTINKKWGIEALVPVDMKIRRNFSEKSLLYMGSEIWGNAYHIVVNNPTWVNYNNLELRRTILRLLAEFDREIHDWLWMGITAGIQQPISLNLATAPGRRKDIIVRNTVGAAPFFNVSIFVVPPRTLENRLLNGR